MKSILIEIPDDMALPDTPSDEDLARAFRLAAAIEWYREGRISQSKGAELAGLSRAAFMDALFLAKAPACQETVEDLMGVWDRGREADP